MEAGRKETRLERKRREKGLTQMELARLSLVSKSAISRIERDAGSTQKANWIALAKALGCEVEDIRDPRLGTPRKEEGGAEP